MYNYDRVHVWTLSGDSAWCVLNFVGQKSVWDRGNRCAHYANSLGQG